MTGLACRDEIWDNAVTTMTRVGKDEGMIPRGKNGMEEMEVQDRKGGKEARCSTLFYQLMS